MPIDIFDSYHLTAIAEEVVPTTTFFKDRYFPTGANDIFASEKVLTEYRKGDRKMAAIVSPRAGDIPIERRGYEMHEYTPVYIAPSRLLTVDELKRRGFGEALYANTEPAQRAAKLILQDMQDMEMRTARREEYMCAMLMQNNALDLTPMIDEDTEDEDVRIQYYDGASDHEFTVATKWNGTGGNMFGDIRAMCRMLSSRGLRAADLVLGIDVADAILEDAILRERIRTDSGIATGGIDQAQTAYDGVASMGAINFNGYRLNLFSVDETYVDDNGTVQSYFPATAAMVTAPGCGHMMYGAVTQIDYGSADFTTHTGVRIPKLSVLQEKDIRKLRLASRPLPAPVNYCPFIIAKNAVG